MTTGQKDSCMSRHSLDLWSVHPNAQDPGTEAIRITRGRLDRSVNRNKGALFFPSQSAMVGRAEGEVLAAWKWNRRAKLSARTRSEDAPNK